MKKCPFLGKKCIEHECMLYSHITMRDPQTGVDKDEWTCSLALLPMVMLENARQTRGVQTAVEDSRNQIVKRQDALNAAIDAAQRGRIGHNHESVTDVPPHRRLYSDPEAGTGMDEGPPINGDGG